MAFTLVWHDGKWNKETAPNFAAAKAKFDSWQWKYASVVTGNGGHVYFAYAGAQEMHHQACAQAGGKVGEEPVNNNPSFRMTWHHGRYHRAQYGSYGEAFKAFDGVNADKSAIARVVLHGSKVVLAYVGSESIHTNLVAHAGREWFLTWHDGGFKAENFNSFAAGKAKFDSFNWTKAACLADPEGHVYLAYSGAESLQQQIHAQHLQLYDEKVGNDKYRMAWHSGSYQMADYNSYAEALAAFDKVNADKNAIARIIIKQGWILAAYVGGEGIRTGLLQQSAK